MTRRPKSSRRLTSDETALWQSVADKLDRLAPKSGPPPEPAPPPAAKPVAKGRERDPAPLPAFRMGEKARLRGGGTDLQAPVHERVNGAALNMDRKAYLRMRRGKLVPEGRIDLHGMTLARAHPALNRFILSSRAQGKRLVLVITGKGRDRDDGDPVPTPRGVLRHQVPMWLSMPPLAQAVLQVTTAHISHGGGGAYYVYLRKGG